LAYVGHAPQLVFQERWLFLQAALLWAEAATLMQEEKKIDGDRERLGAAVGRT
tara:strand:- start:504 stop:662 length:159 start_codon:yes stop_codon:yes gene_type:complete